MTTAIPSTARAPTTSTPTTRHKTFKNISPHSIHPHPWTFARVLRVSRPSARARVSPQSNRAPDGAPRRRDVAMRRRDVATSRRRATRDNTYLDLGRLEGGDAGDEGGREEGRHFQGNARCANMTTATTTTRARSMRCDGWMKMDGWVRSIRRCDRDRDGVSNPHAIDRYRYRSTVPIAIDARDDKIARRHATGR